MLESFSTSTGQMLARIEGIGTCLYQPKIVMAPGGTHAFVMCQGTGAQNSIAIVNLATQSVGAYARVQGGDPADIAISPNGKQFYLSTTKTGSGVSVLGGGPAPASTVQRPVYERPQVPAFAAHVSVPAGHLAISQDGKSLYVWDATTFGQPFYVVNTASLAVSTIDLPNGALASTMAVSPVGNVALLSAFTQSGGQPYYVLNTKTNEVTGTFPAPLFPPGTYPTFGSDVMAFSLDGTSVWSLGCNDNCNVVSGRSFPSGDTIAETSLGSGYNALAITFQADLRPPRIFVDSRGPDPSAALLDRIGAMWRLSLAIGFIFPIAAQNPTFAWKSVNVQGMGYVTGMVVNPLPPNDIYIRTDVGGAYRYDRAAARWLPLMDRFGTADSAFGVESIAVSPNDPNTVYAAVASNQVFTATGGGYYNETTWGGVLVSHSRGVWWADTGMPVGVYMGPNDDYRGTTGERLAVDPVRPGVVYFASQQNGLWRLDANGWAQAGAATLPNTSVSPGMTFILASSEALYAGVYGSGVWSSADGGDTWTSLGGPSNPVRAALSNDGTLVVSYGGDEGATTGSVGRYRNGAWSDITPLGIYAAYSGVTFDAAGKLAAAQNGGKNVFFSTSQGDSWQRVATANVSGQPPYFPPPTAANYYDQPGDWGNAALVIDPAVPTRLFQTNGYGVLATEDYTAAAPVWSWRSQNLEELVVQNIKVPPLAGGADLFSAVADMIGFRHASRDTVPSATLGTINYVAQGTSLAYCASQPQVLAWVGWDEALGWQAGMTGYSSDNGETWTPFGSTAPGSAGEIAISASDPTRLVWAPTHSATPQYSTDAGATWQACTLNGGALPGSWQLGNEWWAGQVLAADHVDGSRFYFYNNGQFYLSADAGATWQAGAAGWPSPIPVEYTVLVNIVPNPVQAGDVWVSMDASPNQPARFPLFHSTDGGMTFSAASALDSANFVAFGKGVGAVPAMYVHGRAAGVTTDQIYQSPDLGNSWTPISDPTQQQFGDISALEGDMRQADLVYVGTSGRGIQYGYGPGANLGAPSFPQQGLVNAASYQGGGVAPGEVVTIFGQAMGPVSLAGAALDESGSLSDILQGTQLFFDGSPAPLVYASAGQLGAVTPYSVAGNSTTSVQVSYLGVLSLPMIVPVVPAAPAIFTLSGEGSGGGVILNQDFTVNSPSNPAARGDYIVIYATGAGETSPSGVDGLITGSTIPLPVLPVTVQIDGLDAAVAFAGDAPALVSGVLQVNVQVPAASQTGPAVSLVVSVGGVSSQPGVTVAVK
jgi:uncharacterized protein (TIGR03437 family)